MQENEHKTHHKEIESESSCSNIDNLCDSFCVTITNSGIISSWCLGIQEILSEYSTNMKIKSAFSHKDKECSRDFSVILSNDTKFSKEIYSLILDKMDPEMNEIFLSASVLIKDHRIQQQRK